MAALMAAKAKGEVSGVYGRLGELVPGGGRGGGLVEGKCCYGLTAPYRSLSRVISATSLICISRFPHLPPFLPPPLPPPPQVICVPSTSSTMSPPPPPSARSTTLLWRPPVTRRSALEGLFCAACPVLLLSPPSLSLARGAVRSCEPPSSRCPRPAVTFPPPSLQVRRVSAPQPAAVMPSPPLLAGASSSCAAASWGWPPSSSWRSRGTWQGRRQRGCRRQRVRGGRYR